MGRGKQKAKQTRIARKLKYLTTDTDYDQLAEELAHQDGEQPSAADPLAGAVAADEEGSKEASVADTASADELDEYAKWAEEAARKAEEEPKPAAKPARRPFPMPKPGAFKRPAAPGGAAAAAGGDEA